MRSMQNPVDGDPKDGSWPFSFNAFRRSIHVDTRFGSQASWMVLGIVHYTHVTGDTQYLYMAVNSMDFVLTLQDPANGAVNGNLSITLIRFLFSLRRNIRTSINTSGIYKRGFED